MLSLNSRSVYFPRRPYVVTKKTKTKRSYTTLACPKIRKKNSIEKNSVQSIVSECDWIGFSFIFMPKLYKIESNIDFPFYSLRVEHSQGTHSFSRFALCLSISISISLSEQVFVCIGSIHLKYVYYIVAMVHAVHRKPLLNRQIKHRRWMDIE